jgi:hypothetical protein
MDDEKNNGSRYKIWSFLNSKVGLLLLGFVLTTLAGGLINQWFHRNAWEREIAFEERRQNYEWERNRRFEILRRKLDEGQKSLEEISDLINLRYFRLHQVFENILSNDLVAAEKNWKQYYETVELWNVKLLTYQNRLTRLVDKAVSQEFNNYETDNPGLSDPTSIHGKFYVAHNKVLALLRCKKSQTCTVTKQMIRDTNEIFRDLDFHTDSFIDRVSDLFLEQAFQLETLQ